MARWICGHLCWDGSVSDDDVILLCASRLLTVPCFLSLTVPCAWQSHLIIGVVRRSWHHTLVVMLTLASLECSKIIYIYTVGHKKHTKMCFAITGDICLHCFMQNLFTKQSAKFVQNPSSLRKLWRNTFWCFLCPTVYILFKLFISLLKPVSIKQVAILALWVL